MVSNIFYFHPYLGKIPNLTNIFQRGWNHQLAGSSFPSNHLGKILCFFRPPKKRFSFNVPIGTDLLGSWKSVHCGITGLAFLPKNQHWTKEGTWASFDRRLVVFSIFFLWTVFNLLLKWLKNEKRTYSSNGYFSIVILVFSAEYCIIDILVGSFSGGGWKISEAKRFFFFDHPLDASVVKHPILVNSQASKDGPSIPKKTIFLWQFGQSIECVHMNLYIHSGSQRCRPLQLVGR